jgi:hypothetical protein
MDAATAAADSTNKKKTQQIWQRFYDTLDQRFSKFYQLRHETSQSCVWFQEFKVASGTGQAFTALGEAGERACNGRLRTTAPATSSALSEQDLLDEFQGLCCVPLEGGIASMLPKAWLSSDKMSRLLFDQLPFMGSTSSFIGSLFANLERLITAKEHGKNSGYKIGMTCNPFNRLLQYRKESFFNMHLLIACDTVAALTLEKELIKRYRGRPGCNNSILGGGRQPLNDARPVFVYLVD